MQTYIRHTVTTLYILKGTVLSEDLKNKRNRLAGLCSYEAPAEVLATLSNLKKPQNSLFFWGVQTVGKIQLPFLAHWCNFHSCQPFSMGKTYHSVPLFGGWQAVQPAGGTCFGVTGIGGCLGAELGAGGQRVARGQPQTGVVHLSAQLVSPM